MDAFKGGEIARMDLGGNAAWRKFWEEKQKESGDGTESGRKWEDTPLEEKYGGEVAEEWKERLACKAEGREFTGVVRKSGSKRTDGRTTSPAITSRGSTTPMRTASPAIFKQKERNEEFFARKGSENAARSADLPPSRGGKYAGFGSEPVAATGGPGSSTSTTSGTTGEAGVVLPRVDEFQKDPVAALTKGFGWFTATVGKGAKTVNDGWIQPTAQKVCIYIYYTSVDFSFFFLFPSNIFHLSLSLLPRLTKGLTNRFFPQKTKKIKKKIAQSDIQTQARLTASSLAQNIQTGTKGAAEQFSRFIEGPATATAPANPSSSSLPQGSRGLPSSRNVVEPERRDFWDSFGEDKGATSFAGIGAKERTGGGSAIGTASVKKGGKDDFFDSFGVS